jgi:hypothetical protein
LCPAVLPGQLRAVYNQNHEINSIVAYQSSTKTNILTLTRNDRHEMSSQTSAYTNKKTRLPAVFQLVHNEYCEYYVPNKM